MEFIEAILKILLVNLILSGDNAVVIAMASRKLPNYLKRQAVVWGTIGAITFRIIFVFLVIYLLKLPFIHFIGGILLLIVAYKLLVDKQEEQQIKGGSSLKEAIVIIIFADLIMSLDNVLAIVAVSNGDILLIMIGIIVSIPIIILASQYIMELMEDYASIVYVGASILAWTATEMLLKEQLMVDLLTFMHITDTVLYTVIILFILVFGGYKRKKYNA
ncbi:YjbE family putative metal transport protein [Virgibacillus salexigens]|uniref:Membrane protein n=1 Tax=Virgibacillus kapii TaxID=1638645 RepID=A0ABQ2DVG2_9BACI|nr:MULTISPECIES: YjbE family putative metal transport protein [Virgibacillus]GGJ73839.1 membrane protein [Virgibacillus kapii]